MPLIDGNTDELSQYVAARDTLVSLQQQLEEPTMWGDVLDPLDAASDRVENVVTALCQQARAARHLASAAEHLCAVLVCESHYGLDETAGGPPALAVETHSAVGG